jgi:predicted small lipoprotein YifL
VRAAAIVVTCAAIAAAACGKKGPPLPPLIKLPAAPADFSAERRGNTVDLRFTVPAANTDNTRPANLAHVDVYAITSREPLPPDQIVKRGARVASVEVKAPRDPNATIDEDEPPADMEPLEGAGLDQGAAAGAAENLEGAAFAPVATRRSDRDDARSPGDAVDGGNAPLAPPQRSPLTRAYVAVGVSTRDRKGPFSKTIQVPLVPPPPAPGAPKVTYDETAIHVAWEAVRGREPIQRRATRDELPSTAIAAAAPAIAYNVYDTSAKPAPLKLTRAPIAEPEYSDGRVTWGEERCYVVRSVEIVAGLPIESEAVAPVCATLRDTFAPAPPANLQSSPLEGAINLIWDANTEKDLAGYIVLRGTAPDALSPITDSPLQVTTFLDRVAAGVRYTYAVKAVDRAGNASEPSRTVEEAAR